MTVNKTRIVLAFVLVFVIFAALTLLFWNTVRDTIIVPIYYFVWVCGLMINSLSQQVFIAILLVILFVIALNTLSSVHLRSTGGGRQAPKTSADTRYQHWQRLCVNVYASRFSRNLFISESRRLILNILAYERAIKPFEVEALIKSGELRLPDGIRDLFRQRESPDYQEAVPNRGQTALFSLRRLIGQADQPSDPQVERLVNEVIAFVESHLESIYAGNTGES
ncbi:MAG TPA: hypothetical protein VHD90_25020 [Phototrophicaceae bacterium]|nr:hypothetical protein [Phototrophicaceae bacterium]